MNRKPPASIDLTAARRARERAARRESGQSVLAAVVASRMDARLDLMKISPRVLLDAGCGTGTAFTMLRARYPRCRIVAVDDVEADLKLTRTAGVGDGWVSRLLTKMGVGSGRAPLTVASELRCLPVASSSVDLVWSNLALHRCVDPLPVFQEMHRVLAGEGLLMFSTLGPDTLKELRQSFAVADPGLAHVHDFIDMHDLGDMLIAGGFAAPVMDMETITLTYDNVMGLAKDLRAMGAANSLQSRRRGLSGRALWARLAVACAPQFEQGRLPATFEIVYGHAWKSQPRPTAEATPQVVKFHPELLAKRNQ